MLLSSSLSLLDRLVSLQQASKRLAQSSVQVLSTSLEIEPNCLLLYAEEEQCMETRPAATLQPAFDPVARYCGLHVNAPRCA
jgi:hypothetical protein